MLNYDEALHRVLETVASLPPCELPLTQAQGTVLAEDACARWDMPRWDNSAMDGFAISGAPEASSEAMEIIGSSFAGHPFAGTVVPGQAVRITTGAPLPKGFDTVVPVEETEEKEGRVRLNKKPMVGQHVRYCGEEFQTGEVLAGKGAPLRAWEIALLASAGVERVKVFPKPRVAIISTGDELVELGQKLGPGQIINSNMYLLDTRLHECGCTPESIGIGLDDPQRLDQLLDQALRADIIISTGGVSVGAKDHVQAALEQRDFKKVFWKVAIKPGKPLLFGFLENKPYFGLPGNPAATAATFELFVKPALKRLAGHSNVLPEKRAAVLTAEIAGGGKRQAFLWCRLERQGDGYRVTVSQRQGSGQNRCLSGTNAIFPVPIGTEKYAAGELVEVMLLN